MQLLDAYAKCTFKNVEDTKKDYQDIKFKEEKVDPQNKIDDFVPEES